MKVFKCYFTKSDIEVRCEALVLAHNETEAQELILKEIPWNVHNFKCEEFDSPKVFSITELD